MTDRRHAAGDPEPSLDRASWSVGCSCGWVSPPQRSRDLADLSADEHVHTATRVTCTRCATPARYRVQLLNRRTRAVVSDEPLCDTHVQAELTLASTPNLGQQDVELRPLEPTT